MFLLGVFFSNVVLVVFEGLVMFNSLFLFYFYLYMLVVHIFDWRNQGRMARIGWVLFEIDFISSRFDGFLSRLLQNFEIAFTFSRCELCRLCNALLVILDSCLNVWGIKIIKEFFFFFFFGSLYWESYSSANWKLGGELTRTCQHSNEYRENVPPSPNKVTSPY